MRSRIVLHRRYRSPLADSWPIAFRAGRADLSRDDSMPSYLVEERRRDLMAETTSPDAGTELETVTSADGTPIAFERTGSGPPLVLVHGGACDHRFWDLSDVRSAFAERYTVYAMDCRGVGESGDVQRTAPLSQPEPKVPVTFSRLRLLGQPEPKVLVTSPSNARLANRKRPLPVMTPPPTDWSGSSRT